MISFAVLGVVESTVVQSTVLLFHHLPIPAVTKYALPVITITLFLGWLFSILARLGMAMEAEEEENWPKVREITTKIILESPTVCTMFSLGGIAMLDSMQDALVAWDYARNVYSYGILWLIFFPCLSFVLEFFQGINGFPGFDAESNKLLKKHQSIDALISCVIGLVNLYLLITIANMSVCKYSYILFAIIIIYRLIRHYHLTATLWTVKESRTIDEIDKKEGIL
jgi:hypothetical protein